MSLIPALLIESGELRQFDESITDTIIDGRGIVWGFNADTNDADLAEAMYVDSATGFLKKAIANSLITSQVSFLATGSIVASTAGWFQSSGWLRTTLGLTAGDILYLSPTVAGVLQTTAPTTAGQYIVKIGQMQITDRLLIRIESPILLA